VRYYYTHRIFMGFCCVCCEVLYLALYLLGWEKFWDSPAYSASFPRRLAALTGEAPSVLDHDLKRKAVRSMERIPTCWVTDA